MKQLILRVTLLAVLFTLLGTVQLSGQGGCSGLTPSFINYEPCKYRVQLVTTTDCFAPTITVFIDANAFESWSANTAGGWTGQELAPNMVQLTHSGPFMPVGTSFPMIFTLPPGITTLANFTWEYTCFPGEGCTIFPGIELTSCPDPKDASIIGVKYRECGSLPFMNQPTIPGWPIQLLDVDGNLIEEQLTGADGSYAFFDRPYGQYIVREAQQPGWTPNVPINGQYAVTLAPSQQAVRNFGNCPACSCDDIYMDVVQLPVNLDTCTYNFSLSNTGGYCFNSIDLQLSQGDFTVWTIMTSGWTVTPISQKHLKLSPPSSYVPLGNIFPLQFKVTGGNPHILTVSTTWNTNGAVETCSRDFTFQCPPPASPPPCCPAGSQFGPELVKNGDFELGNQDFTNDYIYFIPGNPTMIGKYSVLNQSQVYTANNQWACTDHTAFSSTGQMLIVDGYNGPIAWQQTVNVTAGNTYSFYAWFNNLVRPPKNFDDPQMALFVDNSQVAVSNILTETPDQWIRLCSAWTAAASGTVTLSIRMLASTVVGNDVAIDDISFRQCMAPDPCQVSISVTQNQNCTVTVCASTNGPQPVNYQWCDGRTGACFTTPQIPCTTVTYCVTATCSDGSTSSATLPVTIQDAIPPVAVCNPGVGVDLGANCVFQVTPAFVDGGSTDNCGIQSMSVSPTTLPSCTNSIVTLTVTDWCGNTSTCSMGIQTAENVPPTAVCYGGLSVQLGANCSATIGVNDVDGGSTDNCMIASRTISPSTFNQCGPHTVTLTVTDKCDNSSTCTMPVNVVDLIPPTLACPANTTLNASLPDCIAYGNISFNPIFTDNCGISNQAYLTAGATTASGLGSTNGLPFNHGMTTVTYAVQDLCGNTAQCSFKVTVDCALNSCECPDNLVQNPGFSIGAVEGNLGSPGASANWATASGSPQVTNTVYCCDPYSIQMWGNQDLGESIAQGGFNFQPGSTYRISFKAKFFNQNLPANYVRFGFTASNGIVDPFACTTNCENMGETGNITSQVCETYTLPDWTVSGNGPWNTLIIRAFNNTPDQPGDPNTISWGRIDNICITEVKNGCIDPPLGMVSWWGMDDQTGDLLALDLVGINAATPSGGSIGAGPIQSAGKVGDALAFNGPPVSYLSVADNASQNFGAGSFALDAWVNTSMGTQTEPIVDKLGNSTNGYSFSIQGNSVNPLPTLVLGKFTTTQIFQGPPIVAGTWNFVSVSVDAQQNTVMFCVGTPFGFTTSTPQSIIGAYNASNPSVPLRIGYNPFNPHWDIVIDELEMFGRALLPTECQAIYEADTLGKCKPNVAVHDPARPASLHIFPNPNTGTFSVTLPQPAPPGMHLRIIDLTGRMIQEAETAPGTEHQTVQAGALPDGLYFLQVLENGKVIATEKFVKHM